MRRGLIYRSHFGSQNIYDYDLVRMNLAEGYWVTIAYCVINPLPSDNRSKGKRVSTVALDTFITMLSVPCGRNET